MEHELPKCVTDEQRQMVDDLFMWLIQPCLDFIRHECKMLIQTSEIHLVFTLQRLYTCLLDEVAASGQEGQESLTSSQVQILTFSARHNYNRV